MGESRLRRTPFSRRGEGSRCADGDAEHVTGNQQAGGGDGDTQFTADLQEKAHDDKFRDADAEGSGRQGVERQRHDAVPIFFRSSFLKDRPPTLDEIEC